MPLYPPPPSSPAVSARMMSPGGTTPSCFMRKQRRHPTGVAVLHVERAAPVEVAVPLRQLERIELPIRALRLDDVDVADEQDRLPRAMPAIPHDEILVLRILPVSGPTTCTSAAGNPAARKRAANKSASFVVLPIEYSVLVSTISRSRSLPSDWNGVSDACCAIAAAGRRATRATDANVAIART